MFVYETGGKKFSSSRSLAFLFFFLSQGVNQACVQPGVAPGRKAEGKELFSISCACDESSLNVWATTAVRRRVCQLVLTEAQALHQSNGASCHLDAVNA